MKRIDFLVVALLSVMILIVNAYDAPFKGFITGVITVSIYHLGRTNSENL